MLQKRGPKKRKFKNINCPYCNSSDVVAYSKVQKHGKTVQKYKCQNPKCPRCQKNKTNGAYFTDKVEKPKKILKEFRIIAEFLCSLIDEISLDIDKFKYEVNFSKENE